MAQRRTSRVYTSLDGLHARAGRAAEDTREMTRDAYIGRLAKHVVALHAQNPALDDIQLAKGARLRLRDEMSQLAKRSAAVRRNEVLDATGLRDAGEQ
jgi:hypothetical protein